MFIHVVETDDNPCGLVINCTVIGQSDKIQRRCCRIFLRNQIWLWYLLIKKKMFISN